MFFRPPGVTDTWAGNRPARRTRAWRRNVASQPAVATLSPTPAALPIQPDGRFRRVRFSGSVRDMACPVVSWGWHAHGRPQEDGCVVVLARKGSLVAVSSLLTLKSPTSEPGAREGRHGGLRQFGDGSARRCRQPRGASRGLRPACTPDMAATCPCGLASRPRAGQRKRAREPDDATGGTRARAARTGIDAGGGTRHPGVPVDSGNPGLLPFPA